MMSSSMPVQPRFDLKIIHSHPCPICDRSWVHDDVACAFEERIALECSACLLRTRTCDNCGKEAVEIPEAQVVRGVALFSCGNCGWLFDSA